MMKPLYIPYTLFLVCIINNGRSVHDHTPSSLNVQGCQELIVAMVIGHHAYSL